MYNFESVVLPLRNWKCKKADACLVDLEDFSTFSGICLLELACSKALVVDGWSARLLCPPKFKPAQATQHISLNTDLLNLKTVTQTLDMTSKMFECRRCVHHLSILTSHSLQSSLPCKYFSVFWLDLCRNNNPTLPWLVGTKNLYIRYELSASLALLLRAASESFKGLCISSLKILDSTAYIRLQSYFWIDANRPRKVYDLRIQIWFVDYHDLE